MPLIHEPAVQAQQQRNQALLAAATCVGNSFTSKVLPLTVDPTQSTLTDEQAVALQAVEIQAARIAIKSLASLATINEVDHLGGALDLIPALTLTLALTDYEKVAYTIENAHCSIGYYSLLAALGFLDEQRVIHGFRRGIDIPGHVSWVPGGTQLQGGRLGVMIPAAVGQALGMKATVGKDAWVICHTGDAGWISGQALNGFNAAGFHHAPVTFVMQRNGLQLSSSCKHVMDIDPRPIIASFGVKILEIPSLLDQKALFAAYRESRALNLAGQPTLIYPTGWRSSGSTVVDLNSLGKQFGIVKETTDFAAKNKVAMDTKVWIPGSLMSYRDVICMLECIFLVNDLPGGKDHHDGSMKGRDEAAVLANPMMTLQPQHQAALAKLRAAPPRVVVTTARPAPGSPNLVVPKDLRAAADLPKPGKEVSARAGVEPAYALVAKTFPQSTFVVSCDLDPSTKLGKARSLLAKDHGFELSIEEQVAAIITNGLACSSFKPQVQVVSTFAAFFEGIAREGLDMWRYQRNLNGVNEGLNVIYHLSHVGACTGRDHFSGWSLDWVNVALAYLPYLDRFYAPADARSAFIAITDAAARYGAHVVAIPRDNLPILAKADGSPLWQAGDAWEPVTLWQTRGGAQKAILALGATAFVAGQAAEALAKEGVQVDVLVINGLPIPEDVLAAVLGAYPKGVVTIEDGLIGTRSSGLRGFASLVASAAAVTKLPTAHVGITDPRTAPADGHLELWEHFGLTPAALAAAVKGL